MESYFQDWGSKENPIRQSDLSSLYGGMFSCQKRFAMSKLYPIKAKTAQYKGTLGEITHKAIENFLRFGSIGEISDMVEEWQELHQRKIIFGKDKEDDAIERYQEMLESFINSKFAVSIGKRIVEVERAFLVEIGGIWVAGTMDLIIKGKGKGNLVIIDWKTGATVQSQFEMDHGFQTSLYCYALEHGEFYLKPEHLGREANYYAAYQQTKQKNKFGKAPQKFIYAYLKEFIPAKRASKRKSRHESTKDMADEEGNLVFKAGDLTGPVFYHATPGKKDTDRLLYTLKVARLYSQNMVFPENISGKCETCVYQDKCLELGSFDYGRQEDMLDMIEELGIELE